MENIQAGLLITAIGMGLVFVVILALWGLMVLLVKITSKKDQQAEIQEAEEIPIELETDPKTKMYPKIAAVAVAAAINLSNKQPSIMTSCQPAEISLWQSVNRIQQLQNKPGIRKHQ